MLDQMIYLLPYALFLLTVFMAFNLIRDILLIQKIGEVYVKRYEWSTALQVFLSVFSLWLITASRTDHADMEIYYYLAFIVVSIGRILIGIRVGEEGIAIASNVYLFDDIINYELNPYRQEEVFLTLPSSMRPSGQRSVTIKIKGKERETFLALMKQYGVELKENKDKAS